jgi:hypothetical protein
LTIEPKCGDESSVDLMQIYLNVARHFLKRERNYAGQNLWARGYFVDSVGRNTEVIRRYIQEQEVEDKRMDQLEFPHRYNPVNEPLKEDIE